MHLLRQVSRQVGDNEYCKWIVIVPPSQVEELGWKEGEELESFVKGESLLVRPLVIQKHKPQKMSYAQFKEKISTILKTEREGLSWTELRERLRLPQKVPNNLWVKMMEEDIGLLRQPDNRTGKVIWKLQALREEPPKRERR